MRQSSPPLHAAPKPREEGVCPTEANGIPSRVLEEVVGSNKQEKTLVSRGVLQRLQKKMTGGVPFARDSSGEKNDRYFLSFDQVKNIAASFGRYDQGGWKMGRQPEKSSGAGGWSEPERRKKRKKKKRLLLNNKNSSKKKAHKSGESGP